MTTLLRPRTNETSRDTSHLRQALASRPYRARDSQVFPRSPVPRELRRHGIARVPAECSTRIFQQAPDLASASNVVLKSRKLTCTPTSTISGIPPVPVETTCLSNPNASSIKMPESNTRTRASRKNVPTPHGNNYALKSDTCIISYKSSY